MKQEYGDFWNRVQTFISHADDECTAMVEAGRLAAFEEAWRDPIAKVAALNWFTDAKPSAKRVAAISIRNEVRKVVEYYRFAEELLAAEFG